MRKNTQSENASDALKELRDGLASGKLIPVNSPIVKSWMDRPEAIEEREKIVKEVGEWIDDFNDGIHETKPEIRDMPFGTIIQTLRYRFWPEKREGQITCSDMLSYAMAEYQLNKTHKIGTESMMYPRVFEAALACKMVIQDLRARGLIYEGKGAMKKLRQCREERQRLQRETEILSSQFQTMREKYEKLSKRVTPLDKVKKQDDVGLTP